MRNYIDIEKIIKEMSLKEKAMFLTGSKPMHNYGVKRLNIPSLTLLDGPNGLRKIVNDGDSLDGISKSEKTTCFPCGAMLASSWDKNLIRRVGEAIAKECIYFDVDVLLGPAINIKRNPLCGRNFEYYSEDPFLAGKMAANFINGVEGKRVGVSVKHFAANNNEKYRFFGNNIIDERALKEIYLKPYEIVLKESDPSSFMAAYNKINGEYCSQNKFLLTTFLREENNFKGFVVTDWGGIVDREKAINAGLDLEMPGETPHNINLLIDGVKNKRVKEETLNESVRRLLKIYNKTLNREEVTKRVFDDNYHLAVDAAIKGAVLLKNDGILPLKKDKKYLIIGDLFSSPRYQGSGSSLLNPYKLKTHLEAFKENNIKFDYVEGYKQYDENNQSVYLEAEKAIKNNNYEAIIFYGGQSDLIESEGFDRGTMELPLNQLKLLDLIIKENKKVVFVLFGGSAIELGFKNDVNAILNMLLPGEGIGEATTKLLFGEVSPSGRLAQTFMKKYQDVPFYDEYQKEHDAFYKESIFVGYRYFDTFNVDVDYPFGYGLSYTSFLYENINIEKNNDKIFVNFVLKNIGDYDGEEVIQIYTSKKNSKLVRPLRELKAFEKVFLKKGETKLINIEISTKDLMVYETSKHRWILENGEYLISINKNSREVIYEDNVYLNGEEIDVKETFRSDNQTNLKEFKNITNDELISQNHIIFEKNDIYKKPYTLETPICELGGFVGKVFKNAVVGVGTKKIKKAKKIKDSSEKERELKAGTFIYYLMPVNTLRSLSFSSSGSLPYNIAQGILDMCNGHYLKGIKKMIKKEEIKDE